MSRSTILRKEENLMVISAPTRAAVSWRAAVRLSMQGKGSGWDYAVASRAGIADFMTDHTQAHQEAHAAVDDSGTGGGLMQLLRRIVDDLDEAQREERRQVSALERTIG